MHADHFVVDQHLAVATGAGADADGCDRHPPGNLGRDLARHRFHHQREAAGGGNRLGVADQPLRRRRRSALHAVAAGQVLGLRLQPDVPHYRDARGRNGADGRGPFRAALQLHRGAASFLDQAHGVGDRLRRADLVGTERQVADHQRRRLRPGDRAAVVEHLLHGNRHRTGVAEHERTEAVAHQDHVHPGAVREPRAVVVVGGDHRQARCITRPFGDLSDGDLVAFHGGSSAHRSLRTNARGTDYRQRRAVTLTVDWRPGGFTALAPSPRRPGYLQSRQRHTPRRASARVRPVVHCRRIRIGEPAGQ